MKQWLFIAICGIVIIGLVVVAVNWQYQQEKMQVKVLQNSGQTVRLAHGNITIAMGNIEEKELFLSIAANGEELLPTTRLAKNESASFTLNGVLYTLRVVRLKDHKLLPDSAMLSIGPEQEQ